MVAYYFANRMVRLIIFLGPIASCLTGIAVGYVVDDALANIGWFLSNLKDGNDDSRDGEDDADAKTPASKARSKANAKRRGGSEKSSAARSGLSFEDGVRKPFLKMWNSRATRLTRVSLAAWALMLLGVRWQPFYQYSHDMARGMSQPSVMFKGQLQDGRTVIVKDYVEAYEWLRDNTPEDARVMAWWDYGYQIAGIANRTSIADGNTWNHEHIANLARALTATEEKAHRVIRHLADYVLVWSGGGADDMAKSRTCSASVSPSDTTRAPWTCTRSRASSASISTVAPPRSWRSRCSSSSSPSRAACPGAFRGGVHFKYRKVRIYKVVNVSEKVQAMARGSCQPTVRRAGLVVLPGAIPAGARQVYWHHQARVHHARVREAADGAARGGKGKDGRGREGGSLERNPVRAMHRRICRYMNNFHRRSRDGNNTNHRDSI